MAPLEELVDIKLFLCQNARQIKHDVSHISLSVYLFHDEPEQNLDREDSIQDQSTLYSGDVVVVLG